jgi:pyruvate dehydrogenase E2 component (dihydrolipoamide acetyltransferase)
VDLATVTGTGPEGAVTRQDVEHAASATAPADRLAPMRKAIAAAMSLSKREIPHYYLAASVDMTPAIAWLTADNATRAVTDRVLPVVLLIKAVGLALTEVPELNGHWIDGAFRPGGGIHVGIAISLRGGGLVAPAIHDVDRRPLPAIMTDLGDLVRRARAGGLKSSELADPTITLTNLGDLGVELALGIIHPPQVALVSTGRIVERPWVVDGAVGVRSVVTLGLSVDHRVVDGHRAGLFLSAVGRRLQKPAAL